VRIDAPQFALVGFPGAVPEVAVDPGDAGDEVVGLDGAQDPASLRIDLVDAIGGDLEQVRAVEGGAGLGSEVEGVQRRATRRIEGLQLRAAANHGARLETIRPTGNRWVGRTRSDSECLVGVQGFEPRQAESESAVLPLDDTPVGLVVRGGIMGRDRRGQGRCRLGWSGSWDDGMHGVVAPTTSFGERPSGPRSQGRKATTASWDDGIWRCRASLC